MLDLVPVVLLSSSLTGPKVPSTWGLAGKFGHIQATDVNTLLVANGDPFTLLT